MRPLPLGPRVPGSRRTGLCRRCTTRFVCAFFCDLQAGRRRAVLGVCSLQVLARKHTTTPIGVSLPESASALCGCRRASGAAGNLSRLAITALTPPGCGHALDGARLVPLIRDPRLSSWSELKPSSARFTSRSHHAVDSLLASECQRESLLDSAASAAATSALQPPTHPPPSPPPHSFADALDAAASSFRRSLSAATAFFFRPQPFCRRQHRLRLSAAETFASASLADATLASATLAPPPSPPTASPPTPSPSQPSRPPAWPSHPDLKPDNQRRPHLHRPHLRPLRLQSPRHRLLRPATLSPSAHAPTRPAPPPPSHPKQPPP